MQIGNRHFDFSRQIYVMGILNITPDSFSDGGLYLDPERALTQALKMEAQGADLIDVGGESSRPGSHPVSVEEEIARVSPVLKKIVPKLKIPVSIDTRKAGTARIALKEGASLVNDISALSDPAMAGLIAGAGVPVILMHMRGEPATMQESVHYDDVVGEILLFLRERISYAMKEGIDREKILVDPGIGFGKSSEGNLEILDRLAEFKKLECPIVFGSSRKSFIRKILGEDPQRILLGSAVTALVACERGASLLRVHDLPETLAVIRLAKPRRFL